MNIFKLNDMKEGWFTGNFLPSVYKTELFEVGIKIHKKGDCWPVHFHKEAIEITLVIKGKVKIQNKIMSDGDIFVMYPYEIADPVFLEDTHVVIIKTPSVIGDKYCYE